ncbi:hypothetical protein CEXT_749531 [Caerostris extrusa]|uniref:Uncharacterized protein n=1 Tax=Caerostris extrusa TaxID=172846 RepID=A0AAV4XS07_CAEEX|nr:hypothetical protein CEXT_749531 [Caerostris extrusa]
MVLRVSFCVKEGTLLLSLPHPREKNLLKCLLKCPAASVVVRFGDSRKIKRLEKSFIDRCYGFHWFCPSTHITETSASAEEIPDLVQPDSRHKGLSWTVERSLKPLSSPLQRRVNYGLRVSFCVKEEETLVISPHPREENLLKILLKCPLHQ